MSRLQSTVMIACVYGTPWSGLVSAFLAPPARTCMRRRMVSPPPVAPLWAESSSDTITTEEEEWYPRNSAQSTPQLLAGLWRQISDAGNLVKGESTTVLYPQMEVELAKPKYISLVMAHLDICKDVCDHFGMTTTLVPFQQNGKLVGFTAKSFRNPDKLQAGDDGFEFNYDPFWDDGTDFDSLYAGIDEEEEAKEAAAQGDPRRPQLPDIENPIPDNDEEILQTSKKWVQTFMSDMGICPFARNADTAGLPVGPVHYEIDRSSSVEDTYAKFWEEVVRVEQQPQKDISTTLLICPEFFFDNVELYEEFSNTLTKSLVALGIDDLIQLIFFHPHWSFRDGGERTGTGMAANYARRSPWPMMNILRTVQVRKAQRGIPTGLVYKQNEKTLGQVGAQDLEAMLRLRNWNDLEELTVNRREFDALKIARDFQETGTVAEKDMSLAHDATPAANMVDRKQVEQGDLVNVVKQALEKRLGKGEQSSMVQPLSGPETSATSMAAEYLIQEVGEIVKRNAVSASSPAVAMEKPSDESTKVEAKRQESGERSKAEQNAEALRQQRYEEAREAIRMDMTGEDETPSAGHGDDMSDVLWGRAGIKESSDDDADMDAFQKFEMKK